MLGLSSQDGENDSNWRDLWELLEDYICNDQTGLKPHFVSLLQSLIMIPHDHQDPAASTRIWEFLRQLVSRPMRPIATEPKSYCRHSRRAQAHAHPK